APAALILRSPFTSLSDMGRLHYPFLPTGPLLRDRFDSVGRVGRVACPVLIVAGERDQIVPLEHSRRLFDAISTTGQLVVVPRVAHNVYELLAADQSIAETVRFLATLETGDPPTS